VTTLGRKSVEHEQVAIFGENNVLFMDIAVKRAKLAEVLRLADFFGSLLFLRLGFGSTYEAVKQGA
jgi:hypothetical protein